VNELYNKHTDEIQQVLAKYPADQKRSAVMPLLYIAQRERGGFVNRQDLREIGEILDISATDVGSIVGFYTLYYDHPEGQHRIQVCNDLPCALRGADEFLEQLCENLGIQVGGTTDDGQVTVEAVMCLAACDKAPMFQVQDGEGIRYYENQTVETAMQLVEHWRSEGASPAPDPAGTRAGSISPAAAQPVEPAPGAESPAPAADEALPEPAAVEEPAEEQTPDDKPQEADA
jgi:NADH-quinone oxidoreductase subunit E